VLARVPKTAQGMVAAALKGVFSQPSQEEARKGVALALTALTVRGVLA